MRRLKHDPGRELTRALCAAFSGRPATVEELSSRGWASITFTGARHELTLRLEGGGADAAADGFLAGLTEREFALRGHILADIALLADERRDGGELVRLRLEALTVEDC
jgi:hypothetical protein